MLKMRWEDLLFLHWPVEPDVVRPHLPGGLELDTYDGRAWLGVVPFTMASTRFRWLAAGADCDDDSRSATCAPTCAAATARASGSSASTRTAGWPWKGRGSGSACPTSLRTWRATVVARSLPIAAGGRIGGRRPPSFGRVGDRRADPWRWPSRGRSSIFWSSATACSRCVAGGCCVGTCPTRPGSCSRPNSSCSAATWPSWWGPLSKEHLCLRARHEADRRRGATTVRGVACRRCSTGSLGVGSCWQRRCCRWVVRRCHPNWTAKRSSW